MPSLNTRAANFTGGSVLLAILTSFTATAQPLHTYYGLLHAHTAFSDGSGTPAEAYQMARTAGVDFFAVTPHNHSEAELGADERADGVLVATNHDLYNSQSTITVVPNNGPSYQAVSVQRAAAEATASDFVGLYGLEFSTISSGNHVNVLGYPDVLTNTNGDFFSLFQTLSQFVAAGHPSPVVQLNHPNVQADLFYAGPSAKTKKKMFNDYGFDDFGGDFAALVAASDQFVHLIEVLSGPATTEETATTHHYGDQNENDYYFYLVQGFHISPSAGQDNHYRTWGKATPARTGVLAASLSQEDLFEAMRQNRTFATEDKNLDVRFTVNASIMGSCLDLPAGADVTIEATLADADEPNAQYEVTLFYGDVQPQTRGTLKHWVASDGESETATRHGDGKVSFAGYSTSGKPEFFYVSVKEGDGDRAWSAPVWINHPRVSAFPAAANEWVWTSSTSSHVYHHSWCKVADLIDPQNRRSGATPPTGRTLHACTHPHEDPDH